MKLKPIELYIDADACPVKAEVYRVAERHGLKVYVVANSFMAVPQDSLVERVVVGSVIAVEGDADLPEVAERIRADLGKKSPAAVA